MVVFVIVILRLHASPVSENKIFKAVHIPVKPEHMPNEEAEYSRLTSRRTALYVGCCFREYVLQNISKNLAVPPGDICVSISQQHTAQQSCFLSPLGKTSSGSFIPFLELSSTCTLTLKVLSSSEKPVSLGMLLHRSCANETLKHHQ